jgi:1-acyl-sn-glycerol-3-phosphate acyltransferase
MAEPKVGRPGPAVKLFYGTVRAIILGFAKLFWRLEVHGADNIPTDRPFVIAPVHRSNIDFAIVATLTRTRMRYMGKDSLWKIKPLGAIWSVLGAFPVHRGSADREALRLSMSIIEHGEPLVLFPEGTRQQGAEVQTLFEGAAYVASRTGVAIVPVGIGGSERAMPKGAKMLHPCKIVVVVGKPISPPRAEGPRVPRRVVRELTEQLHTELQDLFDESQRLAGSPNPDGANL